MRLLHTAAELRAALAGQSDVALVPTMGNLHAGHISLIELAHQHGRPSVASIFVNPLQFGIGEDFERYPRTLADDCEQLEAAGCDLLFAPEIGEMYPQAQTFNVIPPLAGELCGAFRPGHFAGVCTVVLKLFNLVQPRFAAFGKKDYQQLFLLKGMVRQFNLPITLLAGETLRADDGLALSSRNAYLSAEERHEAPRLYAGLRQIAESLRAGNRNLPELEKAAAQALTAHGWQVDYVAIRSQASLLLPLPEERNLVLLAAARLGKTRLIDNLEISLG